MRIYKFILHVALIYYLEQICMYIVVHAIIDFRQTDFTIDISLIPFLNKISYNGMFSINSDIDDFFIHIYIKFISLIFVIMKCIV